LFRNQHEIFVPAFLLLLVDFSYIHSWLVHRTIFIGSYAASGTTFRVYRKAGTSFPNRVTGFSQLVIDFIEVGRNCISDFLTRRQPEILKTISAHVKITVLIFRNLKKC
jgi:hypothetical protein